MQRVTILDSCFQVELLSAADLLNRNAVMSRDDFSRSGISKLTSPLLRSPAQRDLGLHQVTTPVCNGLPFHRLFPDNRKALPSPRDSARRKKLF